MYILMSCKIYMFIIFRAALVIAGFYLVNQFWEKLNLRKLEAIFVCTTVSGLIYLISQGELGSHYGMGSYSAINFFKIVITVLAVWVLSYVKLFMTDYIMMIGALYWIQSLCLFQNLDIGIMMGAFWIILFFTVKRRNHKIVKVMVPCVISYIGMLFCFFFYDFIFEKILRHVYYGLMDRYNMDKWQKFFTLIILAFLLLMFFTVVFFVIKTVFHTYFSKLSDMSEKYDEIGQYIGYVPIVIILVFIVAGAIQILLGVNDSALIRIIMIIFTVFVLGMQLFYIKLLLKTVQLREHLEWKEEEQINLQLFNSNLQENMNEIRAIKHDMKNVFLTMGEFVERSEDQEFKDYYKERIVPFASHEIKMNDLYVTLQTIPNESLRAFIYYKMMQGIENHIDMQLATSMDGTISKSLYNLPDFIRILGIFIDNAIEEAVQTQKKYVLISMLEQEDKIDITVKNSIRSSVKEKGILAGTTTKGLGRGNGLNIVKQIINKYDNIIWNSYFQGDVFVQMISYVKE